MSNRVANPTAPPHVSLPTVVGSAPCAKSGSDKRTHLQRKFVSRKASSAGLLEPSEAVALLEMHWKTLVGPARKGTAPALGIRGCWPFSEPFPNQWPEKRLVPPHEGEVQWTQPAALRESGEQE
jgi:hypothetical protein